MEQINKILATMTKAEQIRYLEQLRQEVAKKLETLYGSNGG